MALIFVDKIKKILPIDLIKNFRLSLRKLSLDFYRKYFNLKVIGRGEDDYTAEHHYLMKFGQEEVIEITEPITVGQVHGVFKRQLGTFTIPRPLVCEVKQAVLVGPLAVGFDQQGNLLSDTTIPNFSKSKNIVPVRTLLRKAAQASSTVEVAYSLVNIWDHNYYHWVADCLTRLQGVEYYQAETGIRPKLIIDLKPAKWQVESLKLLGYTEKEYIFWSPNLAVEQLIIPVFPRVSASRVAPSAFHWLRQRMLDSVRPLERTHPEFPSRVFISRRKATGRKILNEEEVLAVLTPLGFIPYCLEDLSFTDQVRLFSQAEVVVAPHGAGNVNTLFAEKLTLVELFSVPINPLYFVMAKSLGFQYSYLVCKSFQKKFDARRVNMAVNIDDLKALLEKVL